MRTPIVTEITRGTDHPLDPNAGTGKFIAATEPPAGHPDWDNDMPAAAWVLTSNGFEEA